MKKLIIAASVLAAAGITIYCLTRPRKTEPEDLAGETRPIIVTKP